MVGNKLELAGPLVDSFLRELGNSIMAKLCYSKATGLVTPTTFFIPWAIFRHILVLVRGYSGDVHNDHNCKKFAVTISKTETIQKLFDQARFSGECMYVYSHFKKVPAKARGKKLISVYNGRSVVVCSESTPLCMDNNMKQQRVAMYFFVQHYTSEGQAVDSSLQALMFRW